MEVGTPFSLPDGSAINVYLSNLGNHVLLSDNGDILFQLNGMGIDIWQPMRLKGIRDLALRHNIHLSENGDFRVISKSENTSSAFALMISGLLAVSHWAGDHLNIESEEHDIVSEAEPYIIARNHNLICKRKVRIQGASKAIHEFDFQHGNELIDVISPSAVATGGVMRKIGDVVNGPYADDTTQLIIVDDRFDPFRAENEMGILASIVRTQPFTELIRTVH